MRLIKVATCNLNQWAMDFDNNLKNVKESIKRAKEEGAVIRIGPELEIPGYGCEDHFLEQDTVAHSWECLKDLLVGDWTDNILCSIGMPVIHQSVRYNCQVFCFNRKIIMIRPKMSLANDGNYRERRWFSAWSREDKLVDFQLPTDISETVSQTEVPFGFAYIKFIDTAVAAETCEELFTADAPRNKLALSGVEIFVNASGSHHQLRKLNLRFDAIKTGTMLCGGVYMYSNQQGCDGGRLYYDGCSCIAINGDVVAQGSQFSLKDVEVLVAQVDLDAVSSYRGYIASFGEQASEESKVSSVKAKEAIPLTTPTATRTCAKSQRSPPCLRTLASNQPELDQLCLAGDPLTNSRNPDSFATETLTRARNRTPHPDQTTTIPHITRSPFPHERFDPLLPTLRLRFD